MPNLTELKFPSREQQDANELQNDFEKNFEKKGDEANNNILNI